MGYTIGIDVGGTFTDLVAVGDNAEALRIVKVPSTPPTFVEGVMSALLRSELPPSDLDLLRHASTIATNAIIERRGPRTALITTAGMRDILTAGRANRPDLFDLRWSPEPHLAKRRDILTVAERVSYEGEELAPLAEDEVRRAAAILTKRGVETVAICFLNSFMNPRHELRAKEIVQEACPEAYVCTSFEILPEIREFERSSTTVVNAFLGPIIHQYYEHLIERLREWGYGGDVLVAHSGGGVMSFETARKFPVRVCGSGPAAGAMGGAFIGSQAGFSEVISLDMGGTSADISLTIDEKPLTNVEWRVEFNMPIVVPAIDIKAIGAGGGSIGWVDAAGILRNGPHSAGADPGPACYGKGGDEPTNTDAQVVLGRLNPDVFLGGEMQLDPDLAYRAIEERVAGPMGMTVQEAADGMLRVASSNMTNALRLVTVQRGRDPRDFALVAFGGAGPLHAVELAEELNVSTVVVPRYPGLTSALGNLFVDFRHDILRPVLKREGDIRPEDLAATFRELTDEATRLLTEERVPRAKQRIERILDIRYYGQAPYMQMPVGARITKGALSQIGKDFHERHLREFGYVMPTEINQVEFVNARVVAHGLTKMPELRTATARSRRPARRERSRRVFFREAGRSLDAGVYSREALQWGASLEGPAIVEQGDSTTVIPPGWRADVDALLNLVLHRG
jgi:N-methylhydantoinase A